MIRLFLVPILLAQVAGTSEAQEPCELTGVATLRAVEVQMPGLEMPLNVLDSEVIVRPSSSGEWHPVEVRASLAFDAVARDVVFQLSGRVETGHGMVSLHPHTRVDSVRSHEDGVQVTAHLTPWARIRRLDVPCPDIELLGQRRDAPEVERPSGDGTIWRPARRMLTLRALPGAGPSIRLDVQRGTPFVMERLEVGRGWVRLAWIGGGTQVIGWARRSDVERTPTAGWGTTGGSGVGSCLPGGRAYREGLYRGPAELVPGSIVRASPGGVGWATVRASSGYVVVHDRGSPWVEVVEAPGVRDPDQCGLSQAWARLVDVRLPADVESRRMSPMRRAARTNATSNRPADRPADALPNAATDSATVRE